ncbi:MAG: DUF3291 domain-containing protein [Cyclobacteriaceae bacterium]|nr:DUF3291 domain-containing protein [Cyclobacteriaceae bacterium]
MMVTITSIQLKSPFKFFALSYRAMNIMFQLKKTNVAQMKKQGFWTKHYTMTAWNSEQELKDFAKSGAHLEAMKLSADIATEIRTLTMPMDQLPDWKTAKQLLEEKGKVLTFS